VKGENNKLHKSLFYRYIVEMITILKKKYEELVGESSRLKE